HGFLRSYSPNAVTGTVGALVTVILERAGMLPVPPREPPAPRNAPAPPPESTVSREMTSPRDVVVPSEGTDEIIPLVMPSKVGRIPSKRLATLPGVGAETPTQRPSQPGE